MKNLIKRIEAVEQKMKPMLQQEECEPIGVALGCPPDAFIGWYDHCLHPDSKWHTLGLEDKFSVVDELCYKHHRGGINLSKHDDLVVELLDCNLASLNADKRARRIVKPDEEFKYAELTNAERDTYDRAWEEEYEKLKGTIKRRA